MFPSGYFPEAYFTPRYFVRVVVLAVRRGGGAGGGAARPLVDADGVAFERLLQEDEELLVLIVAICESGVMQ